VLNSLWKQKILHDVSSSYATTHDIWILILNNQKLTHFGANTDTAVLCISSGWFWYKITCISNATVYMRTNVCNYANCNYANSPQKGRQVHAITCSWNHATAKALPLVTDSFWELCQAQMTAGSLLRKPYVKQTLLQTLSERITLGQNSLHNIVYSGCYRWCW
jgi:hypothetical protein